jgi:hypothetical protein
VRIPFEKVFSVRPDGTPVSRVNLGIASNIFPPGTPFPHGFCFAGIDVAEHTGQEVVGERYDDIVDLKGFNHFPPDPANPGWIKGFGVIRKSPWHVAGLFPVRWEAEVAQKKTRGRLLRCFWFTARGVGRFCY